MCTEFVKKRHPWLNGLWNALPQLHWIMQWPHSCQYTLGKWWWNLAPVVSNTKATRSLNYGLKDTAHGEKQATKNAKHVSWVGEIFSTLASTIAIYYWDVSCRLSRKEQTYVFVTTQKTTLLSFSSLELGKKKCEVPYIDGIGCRRWQVKRPRLFWQQLLGKSWGGTCWEAWSAGGPSSPEVVMMKSIHKFRGVIVSWLGVNHFELELTF